MSAGHAAEHPGLWARIAMAVPYIPAIGFAITLAVVLIRGDDWKSSTLDVALFWLVGMNGILTGSGHLFMPAPVAQGIGWKTSPFQWEVGLADLSYGVLGVTASSFGRDFALATIIAFSVFMLGAAIGHVRSMVRDHNFAPGNAGYIFWYDILAPIALIVLYAITG